MEESQGNNKGPQFDRKRHGSLYDRGVADSWYGRSPCPHWYPDGSYRNQEVSAATPEERAEYMAGYEAMESAGGKKQWD